MLPSNYYIIDDDFEEQTEFTETSKVDSTMETDSLTENLKNLSIDDDKRRYKKYIPELLKNFKNSNGGVLPGFAPKAKKQRSYLYSFSVEACNDKCAFPLKMASLYNEEKDVERTLRLSYEVVKQALIRV
ncbi:hypothetical protein G6F56_004668 [Rhizopus delemar]|nr:hypothetical protein G6F56_004668 [Rhizopus delemar]